MSIYRVRYHLHAAGGRLWPTFADIEADSAHAAIDIAQAGQRARDSHEGRSPLGYFNQATTELLDQDAA